MNKNLLFSLYRIYSPSGHEEKMRDFLKAQAFLRGADSIEEDSYGNLLIRKGDSETYPCLAAHMDQVQRRHSRDFRVIANKDICIGYSMKDHEQQGLGADDKNGIFICLECLAKYDAIKVAFFVEEEAGCTGSENVDLRFFHDCRFIIEPDRMNGNDLITSMFGGDVCSDDFIKAIGAEKFGYKEDVGSITDVGVLTERGVGISCLNLSCGYYEPHTSHEFTDLRELENCLNCVQHIIDNCTDVYPFEGGGYSYFGKNSGSMFGISGYSAFDEDNDYDMMDSILSAHPNLSFDDIATNWFINFKTRDEDILKCIYDDTVMYYANLEKDDEDDMCIDDVVFDPDAPLEFKNVS